MGLFDNIFSKKEKHNQQYDNPLKEMEDYFQSAPQIAEEMIDVFTNGSPEEIERYKKENHLTDEDIRIHHENVKKMQDEEELFERHYQRNQKAKKLEKNNVEEAIRLYECNVDEGCQIPETYNRLGSLYHKQKKFDDELRVYHIAGDVIGYKQQRCNKEYYDNKIIMVKKRVE